MSGKVWFTADEHYGHNRIIDYCKRPFGGVLEMDEEIVKRHNEVVGDDDTVVHVGDFCLISQPRVVWTRYVGSLKGKNHVFLRGCHDHWLAKNAWVQWLKNMNGIYVHAYHYPMRSWARKHYGALQLHGHSHGTMNPLPRQWDVGVDNNDFYPVDIKTILTKIEIEPEFNLIANPEGEDSDG